MGNGNSKLNRNKIRLKEILRRRDWYSFTHWISKQHYHRVLSSLLYDPETLIRWRAIEAFGKAMAFEAERNLDIVRQRIRRQLWMMNDESGAVSWHGPEVIAEILFNVPSLADEYGPILTSFLREEPFEKGTHWALHRLAAVRPDIVSQASGQLIESLNDPDPAIRGLALLTLLKLKTNIDVNILSRLSGDRASFELYNTDSGEIEQMKIHQLTESSKSRSNETRHV
jgi:hypothetical protein